MVHNSDGWLLFYLTHFYHCIEEDVLCMFLKLFRDIVQARGGYTLFNNIHCSKLFIKISTISVLFGYC